MTNTNEVVKTAEVSVNPPKISDATPKFKARHPIGLSTNKISYIAMLVALNVAVGALSSRLGSTKITITYTMCFLAGYFFGPIVGVLTGGIGDLLGCLIGGDVPNPIILCASCLVGLIPGLVSLIKMPKPKKLPPFLHIGLSYILTYVVCTLFINTYALYLLGLSKGATFWAYMGIRAIAQTPIVAVNLALTLFITPKFNKLYQNIIVSRKRIV